MKDSITLYTSTSALSETNLNWFVTSTERVIPTTCGKLLAWSFRVTGAGKTEHCDVILCVDGILLTANGSISVGPKKTSICQFSAIPFKEPREVTVASINPADLGDKDGYIKLEVNFESITIPTMEQLSFEDIFTHLTLNEPDAELAVGDKTIPIHRGIISLLSPVFQSKFSQLPKTLSVIGFEYSIVKSTIDLCYGRDIGEKSVQDILDMHKFSDEYTIGVANKKIEQFIESDLLFCDFCAIAQYAWETEKKSLQNKCADYFRRNVNALIFSSEFVCFSADLKDKIIRASANL